MTTKTQQINETNNWVTSQNQALKLVNPLSPNIRIQNSPNWSPYMSLKNELREFDRRSRYFLFGDHIINSHNLIS